MKFWDAGVLLGESRRPRLIRVAVFALIAGTVLWVLPVRRPGEEGSRYHHAAVSLDPFERAGVTEFKEGQRGPAFKLERLDGGAATLDDYRGMLVVLNFWATWCTPCEVEMPSLERLWQTLGRRGLVVVGISVDQGGPRSILDPYVRGKKLTFPIFLDPRMATAQSWRVTGIPTTFLVKPGGEVAGVAYGPREWDGKEMLALLETLLPAAPHSKH